MTIDLTHQQKIIALIDHLSATHLQGKHHALKMAIIALLGEGHLLIEDIPGLGKTTLALALAKSLGLSFGRIQCTSDLLPSDITGLSVFDRDQNAFRFIEGPIFNHIILADEINRAMPKSQSAMLEAMEENSVTIEGKTYSLPDPFMIIATQNPSEQIGTFPLPESQMDRFLVSTGIGYPPKQLEKDIIKSGGIRKKIIEIQPLVNREEIQTMRQAVASIHLADKLVDYIFQIVEGSRDHPMIQTGISTRGAINMASCARAAAYLDNRDYVIPEDVKYITIPTCSHRILMSPTHESLNKQEVLQSVLESISVPIA